MTPTSTEKINAAVEARNLIQKFFHGNPRVRNVILTEVRYVNNWSVKVELNADLPKSELIWLINGVVVIYEVITKAKALK